MNARIKVPAALTAVFFAPLLFAWAIYHQPVWHPHGSLQYGELLNPVKRLNPPAMVDSRGRYLGNALFSGRWTLLYRSDGPCRNDCLALMDTLKRVRLAQGKAMGRVQQVLVLPSAAGAPSAGTDPNLQVAVAAQWPLPPGSVYLLDPQGNVVLRYRPGFAPRGLLKDLHRLLHLAGEG